MTTNTELKPCPFCGQKARERYTQVDLFSCSNVHCGLCHVVFSELEWNTRPIEDSLRAENEKLQSKLTRLTDFLKQMFPNAEWMKEFEAHQ